MRVRKVVLAAVGAALSALAIAAAPAAAAIGIDSFSGSVLDAAGADQSQAGAHPFKVVTTIQFSDANADFLPDEQPRSIRVHLPQGFAGIPTAVPQCSAARPTSEPGNCPDTTQVGYTTLFLGFGTEAFPLTVPIFNMVPPDGVPAQLGFSVLIPNVMLKGSLRPTDFGLDVDISGISTSLPLLGSKVVLWGVPADPRHDTDRGLCLGTEDPDPTACPSGMPLKPFLTNPTDCTAGPPVTSVAMDSWENPGRRNGDGTPDLSDPNWATASFQVPSATQGCAKLPFEPRLDVEPAGHAADTPGGYDIGITLPQDETPNGVSTAHLKKVKLALPEGVTVNPASADGLQACSQAEIGLGREGAARCPASSKIGTVEVETPALEERLSGSLYLAKQNDNPFGSLLAVYLVAESPVRGVRIKLAGKVDADPVTGQLTTTFDNSPQLPFGKLSVRLKGGSRAALVNPPTCGTKTAGAEMTPYAALGQFPANVFDAGLVKHPGDSFQIDSGPGGGACPAAGQFDPAFEAGTATPIAGAYSPLSVKVSRPDGSQTLRRLNVDLPKGLLGKLAGIAYCSDASLAVAAGKTGAAELAGPSCPAAGKVGSVDVAVGPGATPFHVTGTAYLTGPYKGAPLGLAVITPAVAGPFDLGTVVVRVALQVDPVTAEIHAVSDSLPTILQGIPLHLRSVTVNADRPEFTVNPTSCERMSLGGTLFGSSAAKGVVNRFQVGACGALDFKPKLALRLSGPTHRSAYPKLQATLTMPKGGASIAKAVVTLPKTEMLEQAHIQTICTRVQYAAKACPAKSVYGYAKAWSPLLDEPLEGPVYLRSSSHKLPDLVASLDGQIHLDLAGRIDSVNARIRNTFEAVPDAPVTKFQLTMQGGRKGLLVNNTELCETTPRATARFDAHNGKTHDINPVAKVAGCGKKGKK